MAAYQSLAKLFHADVSTSRFSANQAEARVRLSSASTFRTGIFLERPGQDAVELFLATPCELSVINEQVLRVERKVSRLWNSLPGLGRWAYLRHLILDEIVSTNEIEGIHSSRRQISEAIDIVRRQEPSSRRERFVELARLYLELTDRRQKRPCTPEDLRAVYDRVVADEVAQEDSPDGALFRKSAVDIWDSHQRLRHTGVFPESKITSMVSQMIELAERSDIPAVYSALLAHFVFEYIHPFYDGNGRTGRYLLALYLSEPLSVTTSLSLSRVIAENKNAYYKAFDTVEDPLNHGEATMFVLTLMGLIRQAQDSAIEQLEMKNGQLAHVDRQLRAIEGQVGLSSKAAELLFLMAQYALFDDFGEIALADAAEYLGASTQTASKYLHELAEKSLTLQVGARPLKYTLSDQLRRALGIDPIVID